MKRMSGRFFIICISLILSTLRGVGQINSDSLLNYWNNQSFEDTNRLHALNVLIWEDYINRFPETAYDLANQGLKVAQNNELKEYEASLELAKGVSLRIRGDYYQAIEYHKKSLSIVEALGNTGEIARIYAYMASIEEKKGNFALSLEYCNKSLLFSDKINDQLGIARALSNIAMIYTAMGDFDKSLEYHLRSLELCNQHDYKRGIAICNNSLGIIYSQKAEYDKALEFYAKSLAVHEELNNDLAVSIALGNIGRVYQLMGNIHSALYYQKLSLSIRKKIGSKEGIAGSLTNIAEIFRTSGKVDSAIHYGKKALSISEEIGSTLVLSATADELYKSYKLKGNYNKALEMYELYQILSDSLESEKNKEELIHQEYRYKYYRMHLEDSLKNSQALEYEKFERQKEVTKAKNHRFLLYVIFFVIAITAGLIMRFRFIRNNTEKEYLLKEIKMLKSEAMIYRSSLEDQSMVNQLDREKISAHIEGSLNESDWKILSTLFNNPTMNNREISEQVALSYEGVRSSLKKMYRKFEINNTGENQRMLLITKAIRISNDISDLNKN